MLITGATGTGKEVSARYIYEHSGRRQFIGINCASIPEELADSIFSGHLKGSFKSAGENRKGLVAAVSAGTLLMDEIGDLPSAQAAQVPGFRHVYATRKQSGGRKRCADPIYTQIKSMDRGFSLLNGLSSVVFPYGIQKSV
ncbi:MAG TPA: AAA family ATPase [Thermodesulfobacteriaceae bacterium]|nr:AAA family ATPase [Thermodesulfobacteriaceae bacterium]